MIAPNDGDERLAELVGEVAQDAEELLAELGRTRVRSRPTGATFLIALSIVRYVGRQLERELAMPGPFSWWSSSCPGCGRRSLWGMRSCPCGDRR